MLSMDPFPMVARQFRRQFKDSKLRCEATGVPLAGFLTITARSARADSRHKFPVREIEFASFANEPFFIITGAPNRHDSHSPWPDGIF